MGKRELFVSGDNKDIREGVGHPFDSSLGTTSDAEICLSAAQIKSGFALPPTRLRTRSHALLVLQMKG